MRRIRASRPSPALIVASIALIVALGGTAFATQRVAGDKLIKKGSLSGNRLRKHTISGLQIKLSKLGTVPAAKQADTARLASVANQANSLSAPEGWHEVGAAGEPSFQNGWNNGGTNPAIPFSFETVGFYKDREGVVHLKGVAVGGDEGTAIFQLPPGYRPARKKALQVPVACTACYLSNTASGNSSYNGALAIFGSGIGTGSDGAIAIQNALTGSKAVFLDGVTFRAGS